MTFYAFGMSVVLQRLLMLYDLALCPGVLLSQDTVPACLWFPEAFQG